MEQLNTFLARHPPFDGLSPDDLAELALGAQERTFEGGQVVLVEDGPPSPGLWVILAG